MSEATSNQTPEPRPDRRQFFLRSLGQALGGLFDAIERRSPIPLPTARSVLRPPGALPEGEFLRTCYRCGSCVDACQPRALRVLQSLDEELSGTPYQDPDLQACDVCDNLPCVRACPSGALSPPRDQAAGESRG